MFLHPWASFTHHDGHHTRVWTPRTKHQLLRLRIAVLSGNCCSVRDRGCNDGRNLPSDQSNTYTKSLSTISLRNMDLEPKNHALQLGEILGGRFFCLITPCKPTPLKRQVRRSRWYSRKEDPIEREEKGKHQRKKIIEPNERTHLAHQILATYATRADDYWNS